MGARVNKTSPCFWNQPGPWLSNLRFHSSTSDLCLSPLIWGTWKGSLLWFARLAFPLNSWPCLLSWFGSPSHLVWSDLSGTLPQGSPLAWLSPGLPCSWIPGGSGWWRCGVLSRLYAMEPVHLCLPLTGWLILTRHSASLCLSYLIWKMRVIIIVLREFLWELNED